MLDDGESDCHWIGKTSMNPFNWLQFVNALLYTLFLAGISPFLQTFLPQILVDAMGSPWNTKKARIQRPCSTIYDRQSKALPHPL